mgnify:CR=1 FL=1
MMLFSCGMLCSPKKTKTLIVFVIVTMAPFSGSIVARVLDLQEATRADPTAVSADSEPASIVQRAPEATVTVVSSGSSGKSGGVTLSGGAIAGIVIGSIVGFLLLLWVFRSCMNLGAPPQERESLYRDIDTKPHYQSRHRHRHRRSPSSGGVSTPPRAVVREYSTRRPSRSHRDDRRGRSTKVWV